MHRARRLLAALAAIALLSSSGGALLLASDSTEGHRAGCGASPTATTDADAHRAHGAPADASGSGTHDCQQPCAPVGCAVTSSCLTAPAAAPLAAQGTSRTTHDGAADATRAAPRSRAVAPDTPPPRD